MAIPTLLLPFENGSIAGRDRSGVVTPTASGPVRFTDGANPGTRAYIAEEGTSNLVGNPWHAVDNAGWTGTTRTTAWASQGPASGLITATGAGATATHPVTVPASGHTMQAIVRNNAASARTFQIRYNGANVGAPVVVAAGATATLKAAITGTGASAAAGVQVVDSTSGETYNVGYLGIENKTYATSPCPAIDASGNLLPGYTWAGMAHASASTRAETAPTISRAPSVRQGAVVVRYQVPSKVGTRYILSMGRIGTSAQNNLNLYYSQSNGGLSVREAQTWPIDLQYVVPDDAVGTWATSYLGWDESHLEVDWGLGGGLQQVPTRYAYNLNGDFIDQTTHIGVSGYSPAQAQLNGAVDSLLIFDRPLTDAERTTLVNAPTWRWDTLIPRVGGILRIGVPSQVGGLLRGDDQSGVGGIMRIGGG